MWVHDRVTLFLPTIGVEALTEIAFPVEQADPDHRHPEAACRLEVVPSEDAETPRVLGKGLGYPELGRKVAHLDKGRAPSVLEPTMDAHVAPEVSVDLAQEGHESVVL